MALSGVIQRDFASYFRLQIEWSATQSISNNTSTITSRLYLISLSAQSTISAPGARAAWTAIAGTQSTSASVANKISISGNQKKLLHTQTRTVSHNSNGQLTVSLTGGIDWNLNVNGWTGSTVTISGSGTLNTIPQAPPPPQNPSAPVITYPTTRITIDNSVQLRWTGGTDPQGLAVQHMVAYRNRSTDPWTYTGWFTNNNSTRTYTVNTTNWVNSTTAQMAVRTRNSAGLMSGYVYTPQFTVSKAAPPTAPTPLKPDSSDLIIPADSVRFTWQLNGGSGQTRYQVSYRVIGNTSWTSTGWITATRNFHDFAANTFTANNYEWRVMITGTNGLDSAWSSYRQYQVVTPTTAPTMVKPTVGQEITTDLIEVEWLANAGQTDYELRLLEGTTVRFAETVASNVPAGYITYEIEHGATYIVQVRRRIGGVWSPYAERVVNAVVSLPDAATIDPESVVTVDPDRGSILISYTPPEPTQNLLPSFNSDRWNGISPYNTWAWTTDYDDVTYVRVPARPNQIYYARVYLAPELRLTLTTYNAANTQQATVTSSPHSSAGWVTVSITANSSTVSIEFRITTTGAFYGYIGNPVLSETPIEYFTPGSDEGFTNPVEMRIQRRLFNSNEWTTIATHLPLSVGGFEDLTVGSGLLYEYRIMTLGTNGLVNYTSIFEGQVWFLHAFLHDAENPEIFYRIELEDAREENLDVEGEVKLFAGRRLPIREYGVHEIHKMDIQWVVDTQDELADIKNQVKKRKALLYRDSAGRRMYATTNGVTVNDRPIYGYEMSMSLIETDFREGV